MFPVNFLVGLPTLEYIFTAQDLLKCKICVPVSHSTFVSSTFQRRVITIFPLTGSFFRYHVPLPMTFSLNYFTLLLSLTLSNARSSLCHAMSVMLWAVNLYLFTGHVFGQSGQMLTNNLADFCKSFATGTHACAEHYSTTQLLNPSRQDC